MLESDKVGLPGIRHCMCLFTIHTCSFMRPIVHKSSKLHYRYMSHFHNSPSNRCSQKSAPSSGVASNIFRSNFPFVPIQSPLDQTGLGNWFAKHFETQQPFWTGTTPDFLRDDMSKKVRRCPGCA